MKWISVEDRLLKEGQLVLVYVNGEHGAYKWRYPLTTFLKWFHRSYKDLNNLTHWMPLPEPPKDGEKFRTVKPAPIEPTNFTRAECMAAIVKVDAADEITKRRQAKPDYELEVYITGVRIGDLGKVQWHISLDDDVDTLQAADILGKAIEVLQTNSEPPESDNE